MVLSCSISKYQADFPRILFTQYLKEKMKLKQGKLKPRLHYAQFLVRHG
jgi:hypothetical protein